MKYQVITNEKGQVEGTLITDPSKYGKTSKPRLFVPSKKQKSHEIEVPEEIHAIRARNVDDFHIALEKHLKK